MAMQAHEIEALIRKKFPDAEIRIDDLAGDGNHYAAFVTAEEFRGLSRVKQHQAVYAALGDQMQGSNGLLHALALTTKTAPTIPELIEALILRATPDAKVTITQTSDAPELYEVKVKFAETDNNQDVYNTVSAALQTKIDGRGVEGHIETITLEPPE